MIEEPPEFFDYEELELIMEIFMKVYHEDPDQQEMAGSIICKAKALLDT